MKVIFDTLNSYYLPQYLPLHRELIRRGHETLFLCYSNKDNKLDMEGLLEPLGLTRHWVDCDEAAEKFYLEQQADWVIFGNGISYIDKLNKVSRSVQLGHGIGPKPSYYNKSRTPMTVRFIEGEQRLEKIQAMFPDDNFVQVGFSKLDPLINDEEPGLDLESLGLDPAKQTLLYAPTFNPSSIERFPDNWPEDFADYNILVKAHSLTYNRERYFRQRRKLERWSRYHNVYVADAKDISLLPFMKTADLLLSEASSTLFEFVALGKPVIVCDFYKLKWSYRGPLKYRFEKRFGKDNVIYKDIGFHSSSYRKLKGLVRKQLSQSELFAEERRRYTREHVGPVDGKASERIVDYLEEYPA